MSMHETNLALLNFLGIDPESMVTRIDLVATSDDCPKVTITRLLLDLPGVTETRMFKLVPYSTPE